MENIFDTPTFIRKGIEVDPAELEVGGFKTGVKCKECKNLWLYGARQMTYLEKKNWICPVCERWTCGQCGEVRIDDERVENNLKCGNCAY